MLFLAAQESESASFLEMVGDFLDKVDGYVWGIPLIVLILCTGLFLTIRTKGVQFRKLPQALKLMFHKEEGDKGGEVSSFAALCTALSATIGTGNIVGVATAIGAGGPGALFWMWIAALVGMATKYAECLLAVKYRKKADAGHVIGGPFYYIEEGMGKGWKWLAKLFCVFGVGAGLLGIGTITQVNGIAEAVQTVFDPNSVNQVSVLGINTTVSTIITAIVVTVCAALVIIGGIKRISKVAQVVVPFMAITYVIFALMVIFCNVTAVPAAFGTILSEAFSLRAAGGGALGSVMIVAMQKGVARGIFSNEAGLGSAPIAAATANTESAGQQGLVSMLGTFFDTIIICTMTGLAIVITGAYQMTNAQGELLEGVDVTIAAFQTGLPFPNMVASIVLMICLVFFAFTTILGWDYYSERCLEYLVGGNLKVVRVYRIIYIAAVFVGPFMTVSAVWTLADIFNGLMALPNLIALLGLSSVVVAETKLYHEQSKKKKLEEK